MTVKIIEGLMELGKIRRGRRRVAMLDSYEEFKERAITRESHSESRPANRQKKRRKKKKSCELQELHVRKAIE